MFGLSQQFINRDRITMGVSGSTFSPTVTVTNNTGRWELGDGAVRDENAISYVYPIVSLYTASYWQRDMTDVERFNAQSDKLYGTLDLSSCTNIYNIAVNTNSNLTKIINPSSSTTFTLYYAYSCDLTGELDISNLSGFGGDVWVSSNTNLTSIKFPTSSNDVSRMRLDSNNLTGVVDMRNMTGDFSGDFRISANPNVTSIFLPPSMPGPFSLFQMQSMTSLTGEVDISSATGLGGSSRFDGNTNVTSYIMPTSSTALTQFYVNACGLSGSLDIRQLTGLGGACRFYSNSNLNELLLPSSSNNITEFSFNSTNLSTINMSTLTGTIDTINGSNCNLSSIIFPTASYNITNLNLNTNNFAGTIDLRNLSNLSGQFSIQGNSLLTDILFSGSNNTFSSFNISDCDLNYTDVTQFVSMSHQNSFTFNFERNTMTTAEVNHMLVDLDSGSNDQYTGRTVDVGEIGPADVNAMPDDSSGGYNGDAATGSLISKGFTVTLPV